MGAVSFWLGSRRKPSSLRREESQTVAVDGTVPPSPLGYQSLPLKCTMLQAQPLFLCSAFPVIPSLEPPEGSRMVCDLLCPPTASAHPKTCTQTALSCCWDFPALSHPNPLDRLLFPASRCTQAHGDGKTLAQSLLFSLDWC